jgi:hypothetical protein
LIGSSGFGRVGRVNSYLKKIQNGVVLVKKTKVNGLRPDQPGGSAGSWLILFFHQLSSESTRRARFQNYEFHYNPKHILP